MIACARWLGRTSDTCTRAPDGCSCADDDLALSLTADLEAAATREALIEIAQGIQHIHGHYRRDRVERVFKRRFDALKTTTQP